MSVESLPTLIAGLLNPDCYPHFCPRERINLIETHISWVLLAGEYAYKIKKPVCFGFLDFSSLSHRRRCCNEELRINHRYSPELYLAVVPITGSPDTPRIAGTGPVIEYAVMIRRFPADGLFDHLADTHHLLPLHVKQLAEALSAFHQSLPRDLEAHHQARLRHVHESAEANFSTISPQLSDARDLSALTLLQNWSQREFLRHQRLILTRIEQGCIRECHGDLHLGNIVWVKGQARFFDGIDFNADLRWIDTMNEVAFPVMDLEVRGATDLAYHFLNRYLELTGDYLGVGLLDWFCLYRAMVRAKVAILRLRQTAHADEQRECLAIYRRHLAYGRGLTTRPTPQLIITHGFSGSGKSHLAAQLAVKLPALWIRSDVERKRLFEATRAHDRAAELYGEPMTRCTYQFLLTTAGELLKSGHFVILDGTFLKRAFRLDAARIAAAAQARFHILDCQAPLSQLQNRVRQRMTEGRDPSDANEAVLRLQFAAAEPLEADEMDYAITIDGSAPPDMLKLLEDIGEPTNAARATSTAVQPKDDSEL